MPALSHAQARIAVGLWRLLAEGAPVATQALAERLGVSAQVVAAALEGVCDQRGVTLETDSTELTINRNTQSTVTAVVKIPRQRSSAARTPRSNR